MPVDDNRKYDELKNLMLDMNSRISRLEDKITLLINTIRGKNIDEIKTYDLNHWR